MPSPSARPRDLRTGACAAITVAAVVLLAPVSAGAATIFTLADSSQVIAAGVVRDVVSYKNGAFRVFTVEAEHVLKGPVVAGQTLALVQEVSFPSDGPYFEKGARTLLFAVPLPPYSAYRQALPAETTYWRWSEDKKTAADIATFHDPELADGVARYLKSRDDDAATVRYMAELLASPVPRLRADALILLESRPALAGAIDSAALAPFEAVLGKDQPPLTDQALTLVLLGKLRAPGVTPIAERLAAQEGPLQAPALDALVSLDRLPTDTELLAASRSDDPALRVAAMRGLVRRSTRPALDRVEQMLRGDPSEEVRLAGLGALGASSAERAVTLLAPALAGPDKARINAAADALAQIASPKAIAALGDTLAHGSFDAQSAAAFALMRTHKREAVEMLHAQRESNPDPRVRKVIEVALGRMPDEHE